MQIWLLVSGLPGVSFISWPLFLLLHHRHINTTEVIRRNPTTTIMGMMQQGKPKFDVEQQQQHEFSEGLNDLQLTQQPSLLQQFQQQDWLMQFWLLMSNYYPQTYNIISNNSLTILTFYPSHPKMHASLHHEISLLFATEPISALDCALYRQDFLSLHEGQWLRSEAIAFLAAILQQDYNKLFCNKPKTVRPHTESEQLIEFSLAPCKIINPSVSSMLLFMGSESYILESMQGQNLFSYRYLLIPANTETNSTGLGSHWFLMIYDTVFHTMWVMDSAYESIHPNAKLMGQRLTQMRAMFKIEERNTKICNLISKSHQLNDEQTKIMGKIVKDKGFNVVAVKNTVKQKNNYDCGIHLVGNMEQVLRCVQSCSVSTTKSSLNFIEQIQKSTLNPAEVVGDFEFFRDLRIRYYSRAFDIIASAQSQQN